MSPSPGKAQVRVAGPSLASPPYGPPRRLLSRGRAPGIRQGAQVSRQAAKVKQKTLLERFSYAIFCLVCSPWGWRGNTSLNNS